MICAPGSFLSCSFTRKETVSCNYITLQKTFSILLGNLKATSFWPLDFVLNLARTLIREPFLLLSFLTFT